MKSPFENHRSRSRTSKGLKLYMGGNFIWELPIQIEFYIETKAHFREHIRNFLLFRRFSANKKMRSSPPKTRCRRGRDTWECWRSSASSPSSSWWRQKHRVCYLKKKLDHEQSQAIFFCEKKNVHFFMVNFKIFRKIKIYSAVKLLSNFSGLM